MRQMIGNKQTIKKDTRNRAKNTVTLSLVPPVYTKANCAGATVGGQGGWKVHLAQDNKAGLQRPSRTSQFSFFARARYEEAAYITY